MAGLPVKTVHFDFGERPELAEALQPVIRAMQAHVAEGNVTAILDDSAFYSKRRQARGEEGDESESLSESGLIVPSKIAGFDEDWLQFAELSMQVRFTEAALIITLREAGHEVGKPLSEFSIHFSDFRKDIVKDYEEAHRAYLGGNNEALRDRARALACLSTLLDMQFTANGMQVKGEDTPEVLGKLFKAWLYVREVEANRPPGARIHKPIAIESSGTQP